MDVLYSDFGSRLHQARLKSGLKQAEVARAVGLSPASVCNIEAGNQRIQLHVAAALAEAVGVQLTALLPPMTAPPCGLSSQAWEGLSPSVREFMRETVEAPTNSEPSK